MMNLTLILDGIDFSSKISTYSTSKKISYADVVVGLDGTEHAIPGAIKTELTFSLLPLTESEISNLYDAISKFIIEVTFTDPQAPAGISTKILRLTTNFDRVFLLTSVDGKNRYSGNAITLREL